MVLFLVQLNDVADPLKLIVEKAVPEHIVAWLDGVAKTVSADNAPFVCVNTGDVLGSNVPPPEYNAVIEWLPEVSVIEKVATLPAIGEVPRTVAPSRNCTVPVAPTEGAIVAVKVMEILSHAGFLLDTSVVVVAVCPNATKETSNQEPATSNIFLIPILLSII